MARQAELDRKAEQVASLSSDLATKQAQLADTARALNMAEGRLAHADSHVQDKQHESASLKDQVRWQGGGEGGMAQRNLPRLQVTVSQ